MQMTTQFKQWLKERRKELDLTQQALADHVGCSIDTVKKIEAGPLRPSRQLAELLGVALGIEPSEIAAFVQWSRSAQTQSSQAAATGQPSEPSFSFAIQAALTNLPIPATPLIGREREIAAVRSILWRVETRLLTLTGPPGVGKTRLSLQAAAGMLQDFEDGVFFVALAPVTDPSLVALTISQTLGIKETAHQRAIEGLKKALRNKRMLLVLDNFEQVILAAPAISELLAAAPRLKVLVTSREALHLYGEQEFPVPPLMLPNQAEAIPLEALMEYEAIELFVRRAHAAQPDFALTAANSVAVVEICRRVDGLALAIELAAARIKILTPQAILERLDNRLLLLTGGAQDLPDRQRTLRGAIEWSYSLLDAGGQRLFRLLGVFVGGCTLDALQTWEAEFAPQQHEPVASTSATASTAGLLDALSSLVDKSLVKQYAYDGEPRFWLLETIREYALEQLRDSGELDDARRVHAAHYLSLAEEIEPRLTGPSSGTWTARVLTDQDNMRAALTWALEQQDAETALRICGALGRFWYQCDRYQEGRGWLERSLAIRDAQELPLSIRARALGWAANMTYYLGELTQAEATYRESLALYEELGDDYGIAVALNGLGNVVRDRGGSEEAVTIFERCLALRRQLGNIRDISVTLSNLGLAKAWDMGELAEAEELFAESLTLSREAGSVYDIAFTILALGAVMLERGELEQATIFIEEGLQLSREIGSKDGAAAGLRDLGQIAMRRGEWARATGLLQSSLRLNWEIQGNRKLAWVLKPLGRIALATGNPVRAVKLTGMAERLREVMSSPLTRYEMAQYSQTVADLRSALPEAQFRAAWTLGRAMSMEQAVAYALSSEDSSC